MGPQISWQETFWVSICVHSILEQSWTMTYGLIFIFLFKHILICLKTGLQQN